MILQRDAFENPAAPDFILCKAGGERIGTILCTSKTYDKKFNEISEIQFDTYLYMDDRKNPVYDDITEMKYIEVPEVGFFAVSSVSVNSEGTRLESKTVSAKSYETLLAQKYLELFVINMGTTESIDGVSFYDPEDPSKSLLHLVLEKCPDWTIGHIDVSLRTMQRSFEISRQDVYSFLTSDISEAFGCFFIFDTLRRTIHIYAEKNYGQDTNIYVSYDNLLKKTDISYSTDDIKTCLTITGSDDLTVREINMGYDRIYNFDYYHSTDYMSLSLYDAFARWKKLRADKLPEYNALLPYYQEHYTQINYLTHEKMPEEADSTDWTEYGLVPLQEKLAAYERKQAVSMKAGHGEESSAFYTSKYLPIYSAIQDIRARIAAVEAEIDSLREEQAAISAQMSEIAVLTDMKANFTEAQLKELSAFIREDSLSSDHFLITDSMTDEERFEMLHQMLAYGEEALAKAAAPQLSFSADMSNLFVIPDFDIYSADFDVGNYIWITLRDDYSIKAKLLNIHVNYYDPSDFSVTFGNVVRKAKNIFTDIQEAINEAHSAATSVSFHQSYWSRSAKDTDSIGSMIESGLLSAGKYLSNGDNSEFLLDDRGIFIATRSGPYADQDSVFIGGGRILFTEDNWKTVSMSVGRADVTVKGVTESRFGTFADFILAGYVGGSTVEGTEIIGGTITGTHFNNGNGTFQVDENGNLTAYSAAIKGEINAVSGRIGCKEDGTGGFVITSDKLYHTKSSLSSASNGVYVGTDGISLGANSLFKVTEAGYLTAKSGEIGGAVISSNSIHAGNNNWSIDSNGYAMFKNVSITGVQSGSSFGSIGYNGTTTWGNFNGSSYFGSTVTNPFSGTCVTHIENLSANYIRTNYLEAMEARIDTIESDYITTSILCAYEINAAKITSGTLSVDRIDTESLWNQSIIITRWLGIALGAKFRLYNKGVIWGTINGVNCLVEEPD